MDLPAEPSSQVPPIELSPLEGTASPAALSMSLPAQPFTLWLSPDTWPRPALRLPGNAHTLWLDSATWPQPKLRLPGNGTSLWLCPSTWPKVKLRLPAAGFTLWLDESVSPKSAPASPAASPPHGETKSEPIPAVMNPAITLPANNSFTLWTTAAALAIPVRRKPLRLPPRESNCRGNLSPSGLSRAKSSALR